MPTPMMYRDFGEDMVTMEIGEKHHSKEFQIHMNLVCRPSEFFRIAFESVFIESPQNFFKLPEEHSDVFEAFCDWLYSRKIRNANLYTKNKIPGDLFWLRMYAMAGRLNIQPVQMLASGNITVFSQPYSVPSAPFIAELFGSLMRNKYLEHYVVRHVAARLTQPHVDRKTWTRALKANDYFGPEVAICVAKINLMNYTKSKLIL